MRQIENREVEIILFLAQSVGIRLALPIDQIVWVVNPDMKSIRADYCPVTCPVYAAASCEFCDDDGVPVIATLLLTGNGRFGELDFWKVNDKPILSFPVYESAFNREGRRQS